MVFNGILSILFIIMAICAAIFYIGKDNFPIVIYSEEGKDRNEPKDRIRDKMTNIKAGLSKKEDFPKRGDDLLRKKIAMLKGRNY